MFNQTKTKMKKSVLSLALAFGVTSAFAQDLTSKKGEPFLPEAGDWAISIDAMPFLDYAGNFIGSQGNNFGTPSFNFLNPNNVIMGKMFKDEKTAYRASLRIGYTSDKYTNEVAEFTTSVATPPTAGLSETAANLVDKASVTDRFIGLGGGIEMRRGKTRLQGFYGGEALIWGMSTGEKYKYANELTQATSGLQLDANNATYSTDFSGQTGINNVSSSLNGYTNVDAARVLKRKTGGQIGIGVRAFIGAEYFVLPKISIGGEFGWGVGYSVNTKNKATWDAEGSDTNTGTQTQSEIKTKDTANGGGQFMIDSSNNNNFLGASGSIRLNLHF